MGAQSVQDRALAARLKRDFRIDMERIIVSAQSIDKRLVGAGGKRDPECAWSVGHPVDLPRDSATPPLAHVPPMKQDLCVCCHMVHAWLSRTVKRRELKGLVGTCV